MVEHTISNHGVLGSIPIGFNFEIALYSNLWVHFGPLVYQLLYEFCKLEKRERHLHGPLILFELIGINYCDWDDTTVTKIPNSRKDKVLIKIF